MRMRLGSWRPFRDQWITSATPNAGRVLVYRVRAKKLISVVARGSTLSGLRVVDDNGTASLSRIELSQ
jgi:hypothetical protein